MIFANADVFIFIPFSTFDYSLLTQIAANEEVLSTFFLSLCIRNYNNVT